jgi:hypothetical protein
MAQETPCPLDICLFCAVEMLIFLASPQKNKFPSTEVILCNTGFYKLPGLPQRSQI